MKSGQTIFNKDLDTITISRTEYEKLLAYKQICKDFHDVMTGGESDGL